MDEYKHLLCDGAIMSITTEISQIERQTKYRVRRIEIIAEYEVDMLDRTILLEVEKVVVLPDLVIHSFVRNVQRTIREISQLIAPDGTTAMQAMGMLLWDNDVQAQAIWDEQERAKEATLLAEQPEAPTEEEPALEEAVEAEEPTI